MDGGREGGREGGRDGRTNGRTDGWIVAPLPSVALFQVWIMLARASEVFEPGSVPNCPGSTLASTAGLT